MPGEASEDHVVQEFQGRRPFGIAQRPDAFQFFCELGWKRQTLHPVEAPKEFGAAEGEHMSLLRDGNLAADIREPFIMTSEVGWGCLGHLVLSRALESRVTPALLVEQDGGLIETLLEILLTVLQCFDAPLQQKIALFEARCVSIRHRGRDLLRLIWRDSFVLRKIANASRQ